MNKDDKNCHFVLLIIDISKHRAKETGHVDFFKFLWKFWALNFFFFFYNFVILWHFCNFWKSLYEILESFEILCKFGEKKMFSSEIHVFRSDQFSLLITSVVRYCQNGLRRKHGKSSLLQQMMTLLIEDLVLLYEKCNCIRIMSLNKLFFFIFFFFYFVNLKKFTKLKLKKKKKLK